MNMSRKIARELNSNIIFNPKSSRVEDREERILRYYIQQIEKATASEKQTASVASSSPRVEPKPSPAIAPSPGKRKPGRPPKVKLEDSVKKEPRKRRNEDLEINWGDDDSDDERALRLKARKLRAAAIEVEEIPAAPSAPHAPPAPEKVENKLIETVKESTPVLPLRRPPGRPPKKHRTLLMNRESRVNREPKSVRVPRRRDSPRKSVQVEPVRTEGATVPSFRFVDDRSGNTPWWKEKIALERIHEPELDLEMTSLPPFRPPLPVDESKLCDEPINWARSHILERFDFLQVSR